MNQTKPESLNSNSTPRSSNSSSENSRKKGVAIQNQEKSEKSLRDIQNNGQSILPNG